METFFGVISFLEPIIYTLYLFMIQLLEISYRDISIHLHNIKAYSNFVNLHNIIIYLIAFKSDLFFLPQYQHVELCVWTLGITIKYVNFL